MNQEERRRFLIEKLLRERLSCRRQEIPADTDRQKVLLRSLMNVRHPGAISQRFLEVQDAICKENWQQRRLPGCLNCPRFRMESISGVETLLRWIVGLSSMRQIVA